MSSIIVGAGVLSLVGTAPAGVLALGSRYISLIPTQSVTGALLSGTAACLSMAAAGGLMESSGIAEKLSGKVEAIIMIAAGALLAVVAGPSVALYLAGKQITPLAAGIFGLISTITFAVIAVNIPG